MQILRQPKKATEATKEKYFSKNYGVILGTQDADLASIVPQKGFLSKIS